MLQSFAIALTAGMVATVNPCGFALLPAYLSAFVGLDDASDDAPRSRSNAVMRAIAVSAVLTLGFISVFGIMGLIINSLLGGVQDYLYYATVVIGIALVGLGVYLLTGRELTVHLPKLNRGGADGTLVSMYLFGVSYAVASLSCTIGPFLVATSSTFTQRGFLAGTMGFVLYGLGMGLVVGVLTVAVALAKTGIVQRFRQLMPIVNKLAGGLMIIAGLYVAYYGIYEIRIFVFNRSVDDPIIDAGLEVQSWLTGLLPTTDNVWRWAIAMLLVLIAAVVLASRQRRRRGHQRISVSQPV